MPRRLRVTGNDGEWVAELGAGGVTLTGTDGVFAVTDEGDGRFVLSGPAGPERAIAVADTGDTTWVGIDGHVFEFHVTPDAGIARPAPRDQEALSPPMSATVVRVAVHPGAKVAPGDTLVVLEAMKMELPIRSPRAATVRAVHCQEGALVQPGTVLVELE